MSALIELSIAGQAISEESFDSMANQLQPDGCACECSPDGVPLHFKMWFQQQQGVWEQLMAAAALSGLADGEFTLTLLDEEWESAWQRHWQPQHIGRRLWVRPSFSPHAPAGYIDIELTPGMAFGTGTHATTQLCLAAIEELCEQQQLTSMLDMGAGSGILAVTAAKMGIATPVAIDCDRDAVASSIANARINGVTVDSRIGDQPPAERYDLVVANILSQPLVVMAEKLSNSVGRWLILSGLLHEQVDAVKRAYCAHGLTVESICHQQEWSAIVMHRPAAL
ncbi:MAG: 50S ribosomal protein L11 methyltransferase [Mariprofundales bacterium]|nr:50S ribosomal protein L11 methyltransferase [Mariprofundales bacterium]